MAHVGLASLWDGVKVDVDDLVEVASDNLRHLVQLLEVKPNATRVIANEDGYENSSHIIDAQMCTSN